MSIKGDNIFEKDLLLWNSFLDGDDRAYSSIYKKYAQHLFFLGLQFTTDRELIKDCLHDVFVKIYSDRTKLKPVENIKLYLFIALRNNILNTLKKQKRQIDVFDENAENIYDLEENTIVDQLIEEETELIAKSQISSYFNVLTSRQKEAIHYRFFESMSIEEISVLMDMNYQSVQNLLQRAIIKIGQLFKINKKK